MATVVGVKGSKGRTPLTRERVLAGAVELADAHGIEALTMRNLAGRLGVEAMSLYHHVPSKEALLTGVVDALIAEILHEVEAHDAAPARRDWSASLRHLILTARGVMLRHRWAPGLMQRTPVLTPSLIAYYDRVLGIMIDGGFSYDLGHRALHVLGSRALGFDQELFAADEGDAAAAAEPPPELAELAPYLTQMIGLAMAAHADESSTLGWCDSQAEFEFALDLVLEGLERRRKAEARRA